MPIEFHSLDKLLRPHFSYTLKNGVHKKNRKNKEKMCVSVCVFLRKTEI